MDSVIALRERLLDGETTFGTFLNLGSPVTAEIAGLAGIDWAVIDLEHGSGSEADLLGQLYALQLRGVPTVVRVEANDQPRFAFALDRGAAGVMVPRIANLADATTAVQFLRYPPDGVRGVAILNRASDFGLRVEPVSLSNRAVLGVLMVETLGAVEAAAQIAALDGVDILFIGPVDLSYSLGIPGQFDHPRFRAALQRIVDATRDAGKVSGIISPTVEAAKRYVADGFRFVAVGSDSSLMLGAMVEALSALRGVHNEAQ